MSRLLVSSLLLAASGSALDGLPPTDPAAARVFLVRHAQAFSNLRPAPEGMSEEELDHLTELGREQAVITASALQDRAVEVVLSSPAMRAQETARILADRLGVPMRVEAQLQPLALGDGLDWDQRFAEWNAGRDPSPPGGESAAEMGARVSALVESVPGELSGAGAAVLVAHSEVIGAYLGQLQGIAPHRRMEDSVANASVSVVDQPRSGPPVLQARNLRPGASPD